MFHGEQIKTLNPLYDNRRGEKNVNAKLTDAQVREIRAMGLCFRRGRRGPWAVGPTRGEIAARYGVTGECISNIIHGLRHP